MSSSISFTYNGSKLDGPEGSDGFDESWIQDFICRSCSVQGSDPGLLVQSQRHFPATETDPLHSVGHFGFSKPDGEPLEISLPALQPGAGIYTSPLTKNIQTGNYLRLVREIIGILVALRLPFSFEPKKVKFNVAGYFTSGYANFSVRIWATTKAHTIHAVEVMRECGDRIFVTRVFEALSSIIGSPDATAQTEELAGRWSEEIFDWVPRKLPEEILAKLPQPSPDAIASGISSMLSMVTSPYDSVAVEGCASVGKLAAASGRTRDNMASCQELVDALTTIAFGLKENCSVRTRTNAAMALNVLADSPRFKESQSEKSHMMYNLAHYCAQVVTKIQAKNVASVEAVTSSVEAVEPSVSSVDAVEPSVLSVDAVELSVLSVSSVDAVELSVSSV